MFWTGLWRWMQVTFIGWPLVWASFYPETCGAWLGTIIGAAMKAARAMQ